MKVVLDANVLVSALHSPSGPSASVLQLLADGRHRLYVDTRIVEEYRDVLSRSRWSFETRWALEVLDLLLVEATHLSPPRIHLDLPDADDAPFVEVAAAVGAVIVTGNRRHFPAKAISGVHVVSPRDFLDAVGSSEGAGPDG